jgi:hypothetical protein
MTDELFDDPDLWQPLASDHHYEFAHRALPSVLLHKPDGFLGVLAGANGGDALRELWDRVGLAHPPRMRVEPVGLAHEFRRFGNEHLILIVTLPTAVQPPEADWCVFTLSPALRFFTQELTRIDEDGTCTWCFCEWTVDGMHLNRGQLTRGTLEEFLSAIALVLDVPLGDALQHVDEPVRTLTDTTPPLPLLDAAQQEARRALEAELADAEAREEWVRCERAARDLHVFLLERGAHPDSAALRTHAELGQSLLLQGKLDAAEAVAHHLLALCRRYRAPVDKQLGRALELLTRAISMQGREAEARRLLEYRVQLGDAVYGPAHEMSMKARALLVWCS